MLRFREVLEVGAAGLCAAHGLVARAGGAAARRPSRARRTRRSPTTGALDTLLHLTLAELCGSPTLTAQYAAVRATVNDLLDCIPLLVRNLEHSQRQHTALVEAVLDGDADGGAGGDAGALRGHGGAAARVPGLSRPRPVTVARPGGPAAMLTAGSPRTAWRPAKGMSAVH